MKVLKITVIGLVQGIGYRPFVLRTANEYGITGSVKNIDGIVEIIAKGSKENLESFIKVIKKEVPEGGRISEVKIEEPDSELSDMGLESFEIIDSQDSKEKVFPIIPADLSTCKACEAELFDENNRRYMHPFISCVSCGPRYSVIEKLPYDRERLNLKVFPLCDDCKAEYTNPSDRRCYAQTISCKNCGPKLGFKIFVGFGLSVEEGEPVSAAADVIKAGGVVAVKDIGGYHLACSANNKEAIDLLRKMKNRPTKPFAVMYDTVEDIEKIAEVSKEERELLESPAKPIVLLKLNNIFESVDGSNSPYLGAMLPCNPVQMMLIKECGPLIMTSANISGGVMITDNLEMEKWISERLEYVGIDKLTGILYHDRDIIVPLDDSIVRVICGRKLMVRRARGYAPLPIKVFTQKEILAIGGDLKATFAFSVPGRVYMGPTLSDISDGNCAKVFSDEINRMTELFGFNPKVVVTDKHPNYISAEMGKRIAAFKGIPVNTATHHKAHIASVIAEHGLQGLVLGFAMDGTGYGEDGSIWGGEVFRAQGRTFKRVAHLPSMMLMKSDEAAKNCKASCMAFMESIAHRKKIMEENPEDAEDIEEEIFFDLPDILEKSGIHVPYEKEEYEITKNAIDLKLNRIKSTSAGRYFDAVSSALGLCQYNTYEGEAAMELEYAAVKAGNGDMISDIAWNFHVRFVNYIIRIARKENVKQIVLSGGVFMNNLIAQMAITRLEELGYKVYINEQVSCGDGGLALGQLYLEDRGIE